MKAASVLVSLSATFAGLASTAAPAQADTTAHRGCVAGAVCIYTLNGWDGEAPEHIYYSYGYHVLHNEFGLRLVFNNQYATSAGRPGAYICALTMASCPIPIPMDSYVVVDSAAISYILMTPSGG